MEDTKTAGPENPLIQERPDAKFVPDEEIAAIALALNFHLNSYRDEESEIITIDMPSARYSPWALKGLTMKRVARKY